MFSPTKHSNVLRNLPSFVYKLAAQSYIDKEFPRHIFIETTSDCQLSCEYCPREKRKDEMDFELFKSIIDECSNYGPRSFSLHLFGESLLYSKVIEAISYIKSKNKRNIVLLTTNGLLLNKFRDRLTEVGVDRVIWSYRKNNFDDKTRDFLKQKGLIRFLIEETPDGEIEKWEGYQKEVKHLHNYGGNIDVAKWGIDSDSKNGVRHPCYHLWLAPAVRWNGEITICCNDPFGKESVGSFYSGATLAQFWKSERLDKIRKGHMKGEYKGVCANCTSWQAYPDMFYSWQKQLAS